MRLEGKVAVITGAGSGMGRAMASLFAAEGAKILAADWNEANLAETVAEVQAAGGVIAGVSGNVSVKEDCERLIVSAVSAYGGLDILCNNAGIMDEFQGVAELDDDVVNRITHRNAMTHYRFDPFAIRAQDQCTAGALRLEAPDVDTVTRPPGSVA